MVNRHGLKLKMKNIVWGLFLLLVLASCTNQQMKITSVPTLPDGVSAVYTNRYRFTKWNLSFTLPEHWIMENSTPEIFGINRYEYTVNDNNGDKYIFFSDLIQNDNGEKSVAEIQFLFQAIPSNQEPGNFSDIDWEMCTDNGFQVKEIITPEKIGHDLYKPVMYECSFRSTNTVEKYLYVIHATYQTHKDIGIEIILSAENSIFQEVEKEFQDFINSVSFEL